MQADGGHVPEVDHAVVALSATAETPPGLGDGPVDADTLLWRGTSGRHLNGACGIGLEEAWHVFAAVSVNLSALKVVRIAIGELLVLVLLGAGNVILHDDRERETSHTPESWAFC